MRRLAQRTVATALGLALVTMPLAGCAGGGNGTVDGGDETTDVDGDGEDVAEDVELEEPRIPTGNPDYNTWTTLGDAFAATEESPSYGCDDTYYLGSFVAGGRTIYVVGQLSPELYETFADAETEADSEAVISKAPIVFKADITDKVIPTEELNALVGKTGQELMDAGYVFDGYLTYGGDTTTVTFDKDYYSYDFTFDAKVPESVAESPDEDGAAIKAATVTAIATEADAEAQNLSTISYDPTRFTMISEVAATGLTPSTSEIIIPDDDVYATEDGTEETVADANDISAATTADATA